MSVLVPTLNEAEFIAETAAGLQGQRFDGRLEFIFIDGGSDDGTWAILEGLARTDPRIKLLHNPKQKTPHALNIGLGETSGHLVARMDAHTVYPDDYLARGVARMSRGDVECVGGPPLPRGAGVWSSRVAIALNSRLGTGGSAKFETAREVEPETPFTGLFRRDTLLELGGWDERWVVNQDSELAARIRERGGRLVCVPEMAAYYIPRDGLIPLARQYLRYGLYRERTSRAHPSSMRPAHLAAPALTAAALIGCLPLGWVSRSARAALAGYVVVLTTAATRRIGRHGLVDAAALPPIWAIMHMAWGLGFLTGAVRFGPPLAGIAGLARNIARR